MRAACTTKFSVPAVRQLRCGSLIEIWLMPRAARFFASLAVLAAGANDAAFPWRVEWHLNSPCNLTGFFNELVTVLLELEPLVRTLSLRTGACSDAFLDAMLPPRHAALLRRLQRRNSLLDQIAAVREGPEQRPKYVAIHHWHACAVDRYHASARPRAVVVRHMSEGARLHADARVLRAERRGLGADAVARRRVRWAAAPRAVAAVVASPAMRRRPRLAPRLVGTRARASSAAVAVVPNAVDTDFFDPRACSADDGDGPRRDGVAVRVGGARVFVRRARAARARVAPDARARARARASRDISSRRGRAFARARLAVQVGVQQGLRRFARRVRGRVLGAVGDEAEALSPRRYWDEFARGENTTLRVVSYLQDHDAGRAPRRSTTPSPRARRARALPLGGGGGGRDALARVEWVRSAVTGAPVLARAEVRDALRAADAFVLPTRGEGFNLPAAEAMAMGLPVIVTNFSGPTDFATGANALPLAVAGLRDDGLAEPSRAHLRELMRQVARGARGARRGRRRRGGGARARAERAPLGDRRAVPPGGGRAPNRRAPRGPHARLVIRRGATLAGRRRRHPVAASSSSRRDEYAPDSLTRGTIESPLPCFSRPIPGLARRPAPTRALRHDTIPCPATHAQRRRPETRSAAASSPRIPRRLRSRFGLHVRARALRSTHIARAPTGRFSGHSDCEPAAWRYEQALSTLPPRAGSPNWSIA